MTKQNLKSGIPIGAPAKGITNETPCRNIPSPKPRILLVDDDEMLRGIIADSLILSGYQVVCAEDGEAGWDSLCQLEFDLLITDHNMPRLSGLELIQRLQDRSSRPRTLMITGYVPVQMVGSSGKILDFEVLIKPIFMEDLLQKIESLLKSRVA